jgi:putative transposase
MIEKVALTKRFQKDGVTVCCKVLNLAKSTFYANINTKSPVERFEDKYKHLKQTIKEIIENNPAYGYRRIVSELKDQYDIILNHKPLQKLLVVWGLSLRRNVKRPDKSGIVEILDFLKDRANLLINIKKTVMPFGLVYTDMTEIVYTKGKLYLAAYLDHKTKKVLGYALSRHADTDLTMRAYNMAKITLKKELNKLKAKLAEVIFHQDQGSVYTSYAYVDQLLKDSFTLSYSRKATPTDNPEIESFWGRFKTENKQIFRETQTDRELEELVKQQIIYYNQKRRHSSLQNISPDNYIKNLTTISTNVPS